MGDNEKIKRFLDLPSKKGSVFFDYEESRNLTAGKGISSTLFSHGQRKEFFYSSDIFKPSIASGELDQMRFNLDGIYLRGNNDLKKEIIAVDEILEKIKSKYSGIRKSILNFPEIVRSGISPVQIWKMSMISAILFGMISMSLIYRYLGQNVSAGVRDDGILAQRGDEAVFAPQVLGEESIKPEIEKENVLSQESIQYMEDVLAELEASKKEELEDNIRKMVKGYPIESMVPIIAEKDRIVAAFLIGIARKESSWGVHVPVLNGQDCFNYWGYRAKRTKMGTGGHTCFDNRQDAVDTVAKRLEWLINNRKLNTPKKMSIWKCGSGCASDGEVGKWISDVSLYFDKLNK